MAHARQILKGALERILTRRRLLVRGPADLSCACLTFDDGPHPQYTPLVLDALRRADVRATFFVIGKNVERYPDLLRAIVHAGNEVGHHTFAHLSPDSVSAGALLREIDRTEELFMDILGRPSPLFRPPWGKLTAAKLGRLLLARKRIVLWNKDPKDCECQCSAQVLSWFRANPVRGGDVVLMHDDQLHTAQALPQVIAAVQSRGIHFTTPSSW